MHRHTNAVTPRSRGHTLLEVLIASALIAIALVPALRLMGNSLRIGSDLEDKELLTTFCTSKLEEHLALVSIDWLSGTYTGNFSAEGYATLRFSVTRSDAAADGGITDQLMAVVATTWADLDGDGSLDSDEPSVEFGSKVAKLASYESEVGGA